MGYLIARKTSLSILRINAKIKYGIETNVAVEARGSLFSSATIKAIIINASDIFDGWVIGVEIPIRRALDIDSEFDFKIAEYLMMRKNKINEVKGWY